MSISLNFGLALPTSNHSNLIQFNFRTELKQMEKHGHRQLLLTISTSSDFPSAYFFTKTFWSICLHTKIRPKYLLLLFFENTLIGFIKTLQFANHFISKRCCCRLFKFSGASTSSFTKWKAFRNLDFRFRRVSLSSWTGH